MSRKKSNNNNWLISLIGIAIVSGIGIYLLFNGNNSENKDSYVANRTSSTNQQTENTVVNQTPSAQSNNYAVNQSPSEQSNNNENARKPK